MSADLAIEMFTLGPFETNCYLVGSGGAWWIVDAGFGPGPMLERLRELGVTPAALLLTHAHVDHIAGVDEVRRAFPGIPVLIHPAEEQWLTDPVLNLSDAMGLPVSTPAPTGLLSIDEVLHLGESRWTVLHTPGHSPGGVTLHNPDAHVAIVGDALFNRSIGRTDFPGSDFAILEHSIREQLYTLPDETRVLPGHGPETTIGDERKHNPFVKE